MRHQLFEHRVVHAGTSTKAMYENKCRLAASQFLFISQREDLLVAQDDGPHTHHLAVSEAENDVFAVDLLHWDSSQFEYV